MSAALLCTRCKHPSHEHDWSGDGRVVTESMRCYCTKFQRESLEIHIEHPVIAGPITQADLDEARKEWVRVNAGSIFGQTWHSRLYNRMSAKEFARTFVLPANVKQEEGNYLFAEAYANYCCGRELTTELGTTESETNKTCIYCGGVTLKLSNPPLCLSAFNKFTDASGTTRCVYPSGAESADRGN